MEVRLSPMFEYDGSTNLSILVLKDYQSWISNYPYFNYSITTNNRARQNRSDSTMPTNLSASSNLPNIQLRVFPTSADQSPPPRELIATPSHQVVQLSWQAPINSNPSSYKIYRNNQLIISQPNLSYTDLNLVNGTTYSYFVVADYPYGESVASNIVSVTPNALPPSNLVGIGQNQSVSLSWTAPSGRAQESEAELFTSSQRVISAYRIYRNGAAIATVNQTSYLDSGLINNVSYSYYLRTIYENPEGESEPSNTVIVTPNMLSLVELGSGTNVSTGGQNAPLNICNNSVHGQLVYTAAELNAEGVTGPLLITGLGFDVVSAPNLPLPDFVVRMKHTTASTAAQWQDETNLITTYTNASYMPTAGEWNMLMFSTPFEWNGVDNILVDTAFSLVDEASQSGTMRYSTQNSGYCFNWSNTEDQSNHFSGGITVTRRYNIRFALQEIPSGAQIHVDPEVVDFGDVLVGDISQRSFEIFNIGSGILSGQIQIPESFSIRSQTSDLAMRQNLDFHIPENSSISYTLIFAPRAFMDYDCHALINSNAANNPEYSLEILAKGIMFHLATPTVSIKMVGSGISLEWDSVLGASSYKIYRSHHPKGPFKLIDKCKMNKYKDEKAPKDRAFYKVKAFSF